MRLASLGAELQHMEGMPRGRHDTKEKNVRGTRPPSPARPVNLLNRSGRERHSERSQTAEGQARAKEGFAGNGPALAGNLRVKKKTQNCRW